MNLKNILLPLLFPVIVFMVLFNFEGQAYLLKIIFKPFIMAWVAAYFYVNLTNWHHPVVKPAGFAFFFSWLGDILLLFNGSRYFLIGLSLFLISHLFYIFIFQKTDTSNSESLLRRRPLLLLPFLLFGAIFLWILLPDLGTPMSSAIVFYTFTILTMAAGALNRMGRVQKGSFLLVMTGAILFVSSDGLIAINKFVVKIPMSGFWVMSTYIAAQVMIMLGLLAQANRKAEWNDQPTSVSGRAAALQNE